MLNRIESDKCYLAFTNTAKKDLIKFRKDYLKFKKRTSCSLNACYIIIRSKRVAMIESRERIDENFAFSTAIIICFSNASYNYVAVIPKMKIRKQIGLVRSINPGNSLFSIYRFTGVLRIRRKECRAVSNSISVPVRNRPPLTPGPRPLARSGGCKIVCAILEA